MKLDILPQPDETTCGPTCLHAVYNYYGDDVPLRQVIEETGELEEGGTLGVMLACHALARGYSSRMYTYNLRVFDPTWFELDASEIVACLRKRAAAKRNAKLKTAIGYYVRYLDAGGEIRLEDLTAGLIRRHLKAETPILTGLSATFLYRDIRELGLASDDIRGDPSGHFVVLSGYDRERRTVQVADPYLPNPFSDRQVYSVSIERVLCSILLGIVTYDANLVIIQPK